MSHKMQSISAAVLFVFGGVAQAVNYYVDFDAGNDANNGTTTGTPWKHCVGDANATGSAAAATLVAGDTVYFKGGVNYKGSITVNFSGTSGNNITYKGDGWGTPKAHFDGSVPITQTWTVCPDSATAYGNANFENIWFAPVEFSGQNALAQIIIDDEFMPFAQDVNPSEPIFWDIVGDWITTASGNCTRYTMSSASRFNQADANFWTTAKLAIHVGGNAMKMVEISSFNPATDTVTHTGVGASDTFPSPTSYSVIGHPVDISAAGEYAVLNGTMYFWAPGSADPNTLDISVGKLTSGCITINSKEYITIEGFKASGHRGGMVAINGGGTYDGIVVRNNDVKNMRDVNAWTGVSAMNLQNASNLSVTGNTISQGLGCRGMILNGSNIDVVGNSITNVSRTGIWFSGVSTGSMVGNTLAGVRGTHGNGISVYQDSSNVVIDSNVLSECGGPITYEESANLIFKNNFIDCTYGGVDEWGNMKVGYVRWLNNTIVNHAIGLSLNIQKSTSVSTYTIRNNIIDGMSWQNSPTTETAGPDLYRDNNIWARASGYPYPTMGAGSSVETDYSVIFNNHGAGDYTPKAGGPAVDSGYNLAGLVDDDLLGNSRPFNSVWDIGAYEYGAAPTPVNLIISGTLRVAP